VPPDIALSTHHTPTIPDDVYIIIIIIRKNSGAPQDAALSTHYTTTRPDDICIYTCDLKKRVVPPAMLQCGHNKLQRDPIIKKCIKMEKSLRIMTIHTYMYVYLYIHINTYIYTYIYI